MMKQTKKATALLLSLSMILAAMPAAGVSAADGTADAMTATITLNETAAEATGSNVTVEGSKITISASGSYAFSGKLTDGQIIVNVADEVADPGTVKLFFNGVDIKGVTAPPVYVMNAENTSINLADGTENVLSDGGAYAADTNAVIYAKDDITIKGGEAGTGKLTVNAVYQHALHCNNDVKITGGNITIKTDDGDGKTTGAGDAIRGKTSVEIKGGKLDINSGGDGVKSTKGSVLISGGDIEIKASNDAVQGETAVEISGGTLKANGDRGLTNASTAAGNAVKITGGSILATATDAQMIAANNTQPVLLISLTEEQVKDQRIELFAEGEEIAAFSRNPSKKFDYILISDPALTAGTVYTLKIAGFVPSVNRIKLTDSVTKVEGVSMAAREMDINEDNEVDVIDAVLLARFVVEDPDVVLSAVGLSRADTNGDGIKDTEDITRILKHIAHMAI
ncbi:MAG TPA: hypothetical protein DCP68_00760 [Ruminococcus sp.]|nr:hypothetical protein [Ruminococcus sp.]